MHNNICWYLSKAAGGGDVGGVTLTCSAKQKLGNFPRWGISCGRDLNAGDKQRRQEVTKWHAATPADPLTSLLWG